MAVRTLVWHVRDRGLWSKGEALSPLARCGNLTQYAQRHYNFQPFTFHISSIILLDGDNTDLRGTNLKWRSTRRS